MKKFILSAFVLASFLGSIRADSGWLRDEKKKEPISEASLEVFDRNLGQIFPDVPRQHWAWPAVEKAQRRNLIQAVDSKGNFHGKSPVNRYQIVFAFSAILKEWDRNHISGISSEKPRFKVKDVDDPVIEKAIHRVMNAKIMETFSKRFHGKKTMTRYQVAVTISRALKSLNRKISKNEELRVLDVKKKHWASKAVGDAVSTGALSLNEGKFHGNKIVNRFHLAIVLSKLWDYLAKTDRF